MVINVNLLMACTSYATCNVIRNTRRSCVELSIALASVHMERGELIVQKIQRRDYFVAES
jgi:hypothetical protein